MLLYISQGLKALRLAFSPAIIIEDLYLQRFFHRLIAAALGVITPSYIIISIIATSIQQFANIKAVQNALAGIRIAICVLIISAVIRMGKTSLKGWPCFAVFLGVLAVLIAFSPSPAFIIIASVILGLIFPRKENDI